MLHKSLKSLEEALDRGVRGPNEECPYYPCHFYGQDCTFCFCPFYPCLDESLGKMKVGRKGREVWSCLHCSWIHNREVVERAIEEISGSGLSRREIFWRLRYG